MIDNVESIAVIGAGGIGSYFCEALHRMVTHNQLTNIKEQDIYVYDFDVLEQDNLRHQNYRSVELGAPKATVMALRYLFKDMLARFTEQHLTKHEFFVICADNPQVRKLVYKHCKSTGKGFIDMRCEGAQFAVFTSKEDLNILETSLGETPDSTEGRSCQLPADTASGIIQPGNMAVAPIGMQIMLQMFRGEEYPKFIHETTYKSRTVRM
jgi:molybdopterin/thiamine biosynthesis adenylyltransferase